MRALLVAGLLAAAGCSGPAGAPVGNNLLACAGVNNLTQAGSYPSATGDSSGPDEASLRSVVSLAGRANDPGLVRDGRRLGQALANQPTVAYPAELQALSADCGRLGLGSRTTSGG